jgi:hypothetical protein
MAESLPLMRSNSFDPEAISVFSEALDSMPGTVLRRQAAA